MNLSDKRVLITGASGLIGKEIITPLCQRGFDVYAVTHSGRNYDKNIHWINCDLFDGQNVKSVVEQVKPQYLLNMAWCTTGDYLKSDLNYTFLNSSVNLLKYFKDNGGKRAVFAGTCFEYKFKDSPLKETDEIDPNKTVYSFCKNKLREISEYFCAQNNISFGYGRIFYVYGRNEAKTRLTGMLIDNLKNNKPVVIKSGYLYKDYMYNKDIAQAFVQFLESDVFGVVNICTGQAILIKDFVMEIAKQMHKEKLVFFKDEPSNQPQIIIGDNSRLVKEVGYDKFYSIKKAVKEIIKGE